MVTISTRVKAFKTTAPLPSVIRCLVFGGTHPHNAHEELDITVQDLITLSQHPKCVAIGEAGLDWIL